MSDAERPSEPRGDGAGRRPITLDEILRQSGTPRDFRRLPTLIRRAFDLVWRSSPRQLLISAALQIAGGLSLAGQLWVAKRLLDRVLAGGAAPSLGEVMVELAAFSILFLVAWVAGIARGEQQRLLGELVERHTTQQVMDASTAVPLVRYEDPGFYDRLQRARVNANTRPLQIVGGVLGLFQSVPAVLAVGGAMILIQPFVFLLLLVGSIPAVLANRVASRLIHRHRIEHTPGDRLRMYLYLILTRKDEAHEIRAFGSSAYLRAKHDAAFDKKIHDHSRVIRKRLVLGVLGGAVTVVMIGSALALLIVLVSTGRLDLAAAGTAVGALLILAGRLRGLLSSVASLYEGSLFLEDFTSFVDEHRRAADDAAGEAGTGSGAAPGFEEIEFDRVGFTYPSRSHPSLKDVSIRIRRGEVIALVGENGSGKTTLAKLLAGLYTPSTGQVRWDGVDLETLDRSRVRDQVAVIFQDYARYFLTARENVGIGEERRMAEEEPIAEAARKAGAHEFLSALPEGYRTILGPAFAGGSDLSGGQWQRVALARAHFRNSPLLILDEPTASLDPRAEYQVFEQVRRLARGRTVLLISHRVSSARSADRILVLAQGRLVEEGSHEALIARNGLYAELFSLQARAYGERIR